MLRSRLATTDDIELFAVTSTRSAIRSEPAERYAAALWECVRASSRCYTLMDTDGFPVALFGCEPDRGDASRAGLWIVARDHIRLSRRVHLDIARKHLAEFHQRHQTLSFAVDRKSERYRRPWLVALGFERGRSGEKTITYTRRASTQPATLHA